MKTILMQHPDKGAVLIKSVIPLTKEDWRGINLVVSVCYGTDYGALIESLHKAGYAAEIGEYT